MPPKKTTTGDAEAEGGTFRWTPELERKLLMLTSGRAMNAAEYEKLSGVFAGTSSNGVKQRVCALRIQQRKLFEELGWEMDGPGAAAPKKRGAAKVKDGEEGAVKKARVKKGGKKGDGVEEDGGKSEGSGGEMDSAAVVKEEVIEEEEGVGEA